MSEFSTQDRKFMQRALDLAAKGQYTTTPNPSVGCVLVKNGEIVGEGFHFKAGQPHAERVALAQAGEKCQRGNRLRHLRTLLSLWSHTALRIRINRGWRSESHCCYARSKILKVAGKGLKMLSDASIESTVNLLNDQAEKIK